MEDMHKLNFIHRDIKPDNFLVGYGEHSNKVHIIDLGLAKKFMDPISGHVKFSDQKCLTGTARFASINAHRGFELSRRDDLEAIGNMALYFILGSLPWQNIQSSQRSEKHQLIGSLKASMQLDKYNLPE
jgi:serine/threonine protein kinase